MARRRRNRLGNYPSMSEEMMTLTSIVASLDTVGKHLSSEKRRKEEFREKLILSDRDMKWRSEEAQKNRDAQTARESFQYGFSKLGEIEKSIEKLDEDISNTGATVSEWESLDYINQTDGFKEYSKSIQNSQEEQGFDALNRFAATKDNLEAISSEFVDLSTELKYKRFLMSKIKGFATEVGATLPQLYEEYRDKTSGGKFQSEYDRKINEFTLDDDEEKLLFEDLAQNEMFSDIGEDKVLQMLIRREVAPLYDSSIAKHKDFLDAMKASAVLEQANEAKRTGNINQEFALYGKGKAFALSGMADMFSVRTYPAGDKGDRKLDDDIDDIQKALSEIEGVPQEWTDNISRIISAPPQEQYAEMGSVLFKAYEKLDEKGKSPKGQPHMERQVINALVRHGALGNMVSEEKQREFLTQWEMYELYKSKEQELLGKETKLLGITPDIDKALEDMVIFDPEGKGYNQTRADALGYERDESGHLPSIDSQTGMVLKGRLHPTWDEMARDENARGYMIQLGEDGNYYTVKDTSSAIWDISKSDSLGVASDSLDFSFEGDSLTTELSDSLNFLEQDTTSNDSLSLTIGDSLVSGTGDSTEISDMFGNQVLADNVDMPEEMVGYEFVGYSRGFTSDGYSEGTPIFSDSSGELHGGVPKELYNTYNPFGEEGKSLTRYINNLRDKFNSSEEYLEAIDSLNALEDKRSKFKNTYSRNYDKDGKPVNPYAMDREKQFNLEEQDLVSLIAELELANPQLREIKFVSQ